MDNGGMIGLIIMVICCWGCGAIFYGLGMYAERSPKPVSFWSGTEIDPKWVWDIPAYNHACSVMWKWYSAPWFLSGMLAIFGGWGDAFSIASLVVMLIAAFPGIWILIRHYGKIEREYIKRERLDKVDPFC